VRKFEIQSTKLETNPKPKAQMIEMLGPVGRSVLDFGLLEI
jgi:hypothetical protein